jgi:hypothetical protein
LNSDRPESISVAEEEATVYTWPNGGIVETRQRRYTFKMAKYVFVQIRGVEHPVRIAADEMVESGTPHTNTWIYTVKREGKMVGKIQGSAVDGWWIADQ